MSRRNRENILNVDDIRNIVVLDKKKSLPQRKILCFIVVKTSIVESLSQKFLILSDKMVTVLPHTVLEKHPHEGRRDAKDDGTFKASDMRLMTNEEQVFEVNFDKILERTKADVDTFHETVEKRYSHDR